MDLNDYWQENKRFLLTVFAGLIVFLIGYKILEGMYGTDLRRTRVAINSTNKDLAKARFNGAALSKARSENEQLKQAIGALAERVAYAPRDQFLADPSKGSLNNHYFTTVYAVREELMTLAGRKGLRIPGDLGLPALSPTDPVKLERHLDALDTIERLVRLAGETGVERIDKIQINTDTGLDSRAGVGDIEATEVKLTLVGDPAPMTEFLLAARDPVLGKGIQISELKMVPARAKANEARLEVTFTAVRLHFDLEAEELRAGVES